MRTPMPTDTAAALGANADRCDSRSLLLDRFADPSAREDDRKKVFERALSRNAATAGLSSWFGFLRDGLGLRDHSLLFGQLQSRLLVNMAGGVMENAGLCLDRFGMPYVPGSAVKGCARRLALAAVHEWCERGCKPGERQEDNSNLFADACQPFASPAAMIAAIARVFGWCEQDWATREDFRNDEAWANRRSDFAWACGANWEATRAGMMDLLGSAPALRAADDALSFRRDTVRGGPANGGGVRAPRLGDFAGTVSFLPAYPVHLGKVGRPDGLPVEVPEPGKLELDVVTVHHKKYYAGPERPTDPASVQAWKRDWSTAPDIEDPVPIVFPAIASGHVFAFALLPLRNSHATHVQHARTWLAAGLSAFGLGAKTNAGYGWFDCGTAVQDAVPRGLAETTRIRLDTQRRLDESSASRTRMSPAAARLRNGEPRWPT